jgi:hypothetical protein
MKPTDIGHHADGISEVRVMLGHIGTRMGASIYNYRLTEFCSPNGVES